MKKTLTALLATALCLSMGVSAMALERLCPEIEACETPAVQTLPKEGEPEGKWCNLCWCGRVRYQETRFSKWYKVGHRDCHRMAQDHVDDVFWRTVSKIYACEHCGAQTQRNSEQFDYFCP